jgi:hypothetical protein
MGGTVSGATERKRDRENARRERAAGQEREPDGLVEVYLGNATVTSGGTGPGTVRVPPDEAGRLVKDRLAIYGGNRPQDWPDHALANAPRMRPGHPG